MFLNIKAILLTTCLFGMQLFVVQIKADTIRLTDDTGAEVVLQQSAKRLISLSPGLTELLFAAGAGEQVQGVVSYSDFPPAAKKIPLVGSYNSLDMERIIALAPDLIFAWQSGNPEAQVKQLKQLGFKVYISEPHELEDIARIIKNMGRLSGNNDHSNKQSNKFIKQLSHLRKTYQNKPKVSVFAQIWNKPVMSIGGNHLISHLVELCGGENIFQEHSDLTITPNIESIIEKRPQVILSTGMAKQGHSWLKRWQNWQGIPAVKQQQLYSINPDLLVRHTMRILDGASIMCGYFDQARLKYQDSLSANSSKEETGISH